MVVITEKQLEIRKKLQLAADCHYTKENLTRKLSKAYLDLGIDTKVVPDVILSLYNSERRVGFYGEDYIYIIDYKKKIDNTLFEMNENKA